MSNPPCVARFIYHHGFIRSDNSVRFAAFLEKRPGANISVDGHQILREDIHWEAGRNLNPQHTLLGAADLTSTSVATSGLRVVPDGKGFPTHAELKDYPDDLSTRREIAKKLAAAACFVPAPTSSPPPPSSNPASACAS